MGRCLTTKSRGQRSSDVTSLTALPSKPASDRSRNQSSPPKSPVRWVSCTTPTAPLALRSKKSYSVSTGVSFAATADLFAQRGVNGTSLDDVLVRSGASKSQLYHYFANKPALVAAVIEHFDDVVMAGPGAMIDGLRSIDDVAKWFAAVEAHQVAQGFQGGCPVGTLAAELADTDELARTAVGECFASCRRRIAAGFAQIQRAGVLRAGVDVDALAAATLAAIEGGLLLSKSERSTASLRAVLDATWRTSRP